FSLARSPVGARLPAIRAEGPSCDGEFTNFATASQSIAGKRAPTGKCVLAARDGLHAGIVEVEHFAALGLGELLGLALEQECA
ncbi:MAG: hypothetical protein JWQ69_2885, partial [Pseudomonas sp.]|nr:hypothetical protein [Pseudomonas sp.]